MNYSIINESTFISNNIELLEEGIAYNSGKLKFRAKLQEADVVNNNGRSYPAIALQEIVRQLAPKASERKLLGELDHPTPQGDTQAKMKRSSTISIQNACVVFTRLEFDGKFIIADCETLTNAKGKDLYNLLKDKISIGFSLRAFGSATKDPVTGITQVAAQGLKALTFDVVSNPSHSSAVIYEFLDESTNILALAHDLIDHKKEVKEIILESTSEEEFLQLDTDGNEVCACELDGSCLKGTIEESVDYLINQTLLNNKIKYFSLKI